MSEQQKNNQDTFDQNVEMLEQILEVMPDDLVTLRALYETSVKMQKPEKAFETLTRLDDQARSVQNLDMIDFVLNQYESIADDSPEMQGRIARLKEIKLVADLMEDAAAETVSAPDIKQEGEGRLDAEMALAWDLFQDEQLSQDEYSNVLHDLTEMSSRQMGVPVTVLHVLHDRQFSRMERLMTHLSHKNKMPIMMLSLFEGNEETCRMLPLEFVCRNGVLPFEKVGDDLLVAVLNPMDQELVEKAQKLSGRRCHPYLVPPDEYDQQLSKLKLGAA
jgi:hypothetical protein